jgi:hypothetical protein
MTTAVRAFLAVLRNPSLRRLQLAWGCWTTVDWAFTVAISVFAYSRGGAPAVGLVNLVRLVLAAVTAPFTSGLGDRFPRRLLLVQVETTLCVILLLSAIVTTVGGPDLLDQGAGAQKRRAVMRLPISALVDCRV